MRPTIQIDRKNRPSARRPVRSARSGTALAGLSGFVGRFPARHHGLALGTATIVLALFGLLGDGGGERAVAGQWHTRPLAVPEPELPAPPDVGAPQGRWQTVEIMPGQTLARIFADFGLTAGDVHRFVSVDQNTARLGRLYPGDVLALRLGDDGAITALEYQLDEATRLRVEEGPEGMRSSLLAEKLTRQVREASGVIEDSFFLAGRRAGLGDAMILEVARLFGWDIDFVLDIRAGDRFHLVYEEIFRNGEYLRPGAILGASFVNQGREYRALRFETEHGFEYFSPDGRNMRKAFLRAPLNFTRITSHFNPKRFHPILKQVRPHRGIDYGAPAGTPVYAAGDGRVVRSAYDRANGHHVFIEHPNGITTRYLHFTRRAVERGERVRQGQTIGFVGATGLATAPHLHYEFLLDGVHRNPATVDLPKAEPLAPVLLADFERHVRPVMAQLDRLAEGPDGTAIARVE